MSIDADWAIIENKFQREIIKIVDFTMIKDFIKTYPQKQHDQLVVFVKRNLFKIAEILIDLEFFKSIGFLVWFSFLDGEIYAFAKQEKTIFKYKIEKKEIK